MKKSLLYPNTIFPFQWIILIFSILLFCSFSRFDFSTSENLNGLTECSEGNDPLIFLYEGQPKRFNFLLDKKKYNVSFCNLEPNQEYYLIINSLYGASCEGLMVDEFGETFKELNFTPSSSCFDLEVKNPCEQKEIETVFSLRKLGTEKEPTITKPSDDQPELPVLTVGGGLTAQQLVEDIFIGGGCFDVSNATFIGGAALGVGTFANGTTSVGYDNGIIMSSGLITSAPGPNNNGAVSGDNTGGGDGDLTLVSGFPVFDAAGLEFDFKPTVSTVEFNFAFASDEYCQYVGTSFNDVFGFFISGPGINGFFSNNGQNIAVVPGTGQPVTINNVNNATPGLFLPNWDTPGADNCGGTTNMLDIQYDGYTKTFTAVANVIPCETYHIRLVVGDVSDGQLDSAVFLEAGSFDAGGNASGSAEIPFTGTNEIFEGCGDGFLTFTRQSNDLTLPLTIDLIISPTSTATNGVDVMPLIPTSVTIPPGAQVWTIPISAIADGIPEGTETFNIEIVNSCSCDNGEIELLVTDVPEITGALSDESHCASAPITLNPNASGGVPPLIYNWSNGSNAPFITEVVSQTTTFTVTISDVCGNQFIDEATIDISALPTATIFGFTEICQPGNPTGFLTVELTGSPPWTIFPVVNGMALPPIQNIMSSPYILPVSQVGNYSIAVIEGNGCPGVPNGIGTVIETLVDAVTLVSNASCEGQPDGEIDLLPFAGQTPLSFAWSNGTFQEDLELVPAGTYTVTITDANGCTGSVEEVVGEGGALTVAGAALSGATCNSPNGGSIDLTINGTGSNYTFNWDNGAPPVEDPTGLAAGTYNVTVTADGGCTATTSITVSANTTQPTAVANTAPPALGCNTTSISLDGNGSSTGNVSYSWTTSNGNILSGETTLNPNVNQAGEYQLLVTDNDNGCTATVTVTVTGSTDVPTASAISNSSIDCNNSSVSIDGTGSSTNNVSYLWTTTNGNIVSGNTTLNPSVSAAGTYVLQVTNNGNGCTATASVDVSENTNPPIAITNSNAMIDCNNNTVSLDGNGSSTNNVSYLWTTGNGSITGGETTLTPSVNAAGTYQLQVTDNSNGCTSTATVTVTADNTLPTVTIANAGNVTCATTSFSLDGTGSSTGTYLWTTSSGNIISGETTLTPTIGAPGFYVLQVTSSNGCTATSSITVGEDLTPPIAQAGTADPIGCNTTSISLNGNGSSPSGNISFLWTTTNGNILSGETTLNPTIDATGNYILIVTNEDNGCTAESSVTVTGSTDLPTADAGMPNNLTCTTTELSLDGTNSDMGSGITYLWTTTNGNIVSGNTSLNPIIDLPGTYQLEVTGANGCVSTSTVTIGENSVPPLAVATAPNSLDCGTPSASIDGTGSATGSGITYLWTTSTGNIVSGETTLTPDVNSAGTYELLVTDNNTGCTSTASVDITANNDLPTVTIASANDLTCDNNSFTLDGNGSSMGTYLWTTSIGNIVSGNTTLNPTIDLPGIYILEVTASNGCAATSSITIGENISTPIAEAGTADPFGCTTSTISLDGGTSSTGGNYSYLWTSPNGSIVSGETTLTPTVDAAGTYVLLVTNDDNGCTAESSVTVEASTDLPTADAGEVDDVTCLVNEFTLDGSDSETGAGITYLWTTNNGTILSGETSLMPMVTGVGIYSLLVTDSNTGCSAISTVTVLANNIPPIVEFEVAPTLGCSQGSASLSGSGSGTGIEFEYLWTTTNGNIISGETTLNPEINAAGTYQLLITNTITGCTASDEITVMADSDVPTATIEPANDLTCSVLEIMLNGDGSSTGTEFEYLWTTSTGNIVSGETTLNPTVDGDGTYILQVTNTGNGCTNTASMMVSTSSDLPTVDAGMVSVIDCDNPTIALDGTGSSSGTEYTYLWTTSNGNIVSGETTLTPEVNAAGDYTLTINNSITGCSNETNLTVTGDAIEPIAFINIADPITCTQTTTSLDGVGSSAGTDFTYLWTTTGGNIVSGETTLNPIVNAAGTYELVVTNTQNGCTNSETVVVTVDGDVPEANAGDNALLNCNIINTSLNGTGATGTDITYLWTTTDGNIVSGENTLTPDVDAAGTYQLTVSNSANGCSNTSTVLVALDDVTPTADAGIAPSISCTSTTVELDGSASSTGNVTYLWTTSNGNILSGETTLNPEVNAVGIYELTVTSLDNGCTETAEVEVTQDSSLPTANAGDGFEITCEVFGGTLNGTASTTSLDITYLWTTTDGNIVSGETTLTPEVDAAGVYQLLLTDGSNGCTAISSVIISENNTPPNADAGMTMELNCVNNTLVIDGTNSDSGNELTYLWTTSNGMILSGETTLTPEITSEGTYELLVSNTSSGCTSTSSVVITESFETPDIVIVPPAELNCTSNTASLDGTGSSTGSNFTYQWTTTNGNITAGATTLEPQIDAAGDYVLLITNTSNGCTSTESVEVTQSVDLPNADAVVLDNLTCTTTEITLGGGTSSTGTEFEYLWTTTDGNIVLGNTTLTPTVDAPGDYILTVTNIDNSCTATSQVTVMETIDLPTAIAGSTATLTCTVSEAQLDGTGSSTGTEFEYLWTTTNGTIISGETTLMPQVGAVGIYQLEVTNTTTGCTSTSTTEVNSNGDLPAAVATPDGMLTCNTLSVELNGTGSAAGSDFSYLWTTTDGNIVSGETTLNPVVDATGTYILLVTNNLNGCTSQVSTMVEDDINPPSALVNQTTSLLLDCTNSSLVLDGSGSTPVGNVTYQWTTTNGNIVSGANTANPEVNAAGTYTLLVTDANNGCTNEVEVEVDQDTSIPSATIATPQVLTCDLTQFSLSATGPTTGSYTYLWTTTNGNITSGDNTLEPTINQPGQYALTIIDQNNNCESTVSITVSENTTPPTAEAGTADMLDCETTSVTLNGNGSSVGNNINYQWVSTNGNIVGNNNTISVVADAAGLYMLTVTNEGNGCTASDNVLVEQDASTPTDIIYTIDEPECEGGQGDIIIETVQGGTPPYLYSIDGDNFYNGHIFTLPGGDYILYAQDADGCEIQTEFSIPIIEPVSVTLVPEANIELGDNYEIETLTNIPLDEIETITWAPASYLSCTDCLNPTVEQLFDNITYTVTITNIYGCVATASIHIEVDKDRAIYLPNVFTPNGDGNNDFFYIFAGPDAQIVSIKNFHIFDRWGEVVYTATDFPPNDSAYGWDGTLRGQKMNPAVFVYWFEVEFLDGERIIYEGDVALRRN